MRLSGFSPSSSPLPRNAETPGKPTQAQPQAGKASADASVLSFMSPAESQTQPLNGNAVSGNSDRTGESSLDAMIKQLIQTVMSTLLQESGASGAAASLSAVSDDPSLVEGTGDTMSFEQVATTLGRHEDLLKKPQNREGLEKLRDDASTPSDMKKALDTLLNDPDMFAAFDSAKNGKSDGKISNKDVRTWQQNPAIRQYADAKAETYTHDYVPSDAKPGSPPREMSSNDAMRELYLYSESLPKKINQETLRKIADGSQDMGKCPPQVAAAAKFYTDHPDQWQQLTGKEDPNASVSRDRLCDLASYNVKLSPQESKALETLQNNEDIFFKGGGIKPDKLTKIANDSNNSQEVRDAANLLSQPNSMLFSMLDNGKHGAGGNFFNKANDHNIGKGDIDAFIKKGTNQVATPDALSGVPANINEQRAQQEMATGQETQPDAKKEKGGGIYKLLEVLSYVATAITAVIPGVGAAGLAATGARAAVTAGLKEGLKQGIKEGVKEGASQALDAAQTAKKGNEEIKGERVWAQA